MKELKKDVYFRLLRMSWIKLIICIFIFYSAGNLIFALIYKRVPNSINNINPDFETAFYFSVQTMSTIGYGTLNPTGNISNILVLIESFIGLITFSIITGVVFAKLSRPVAQIRFSKKVLFTKYDGVQSICLRIGNMRGNNIVEAKARLSALFNEVTQEGEKIKRVYNLDLVRDYSPFFRLSWLIIHPINERSPLYFKENFEEVIDGIMLTVTGHDGTYSTTIYDQHLYLKEDLVKNKYFQDIMLEEKDGSMKVDYGKFDVLK